MKVMVNALLGLLMVAMSIPAMASWPQRDSEGRELPSLADMLEQVNPAVVNISVYATRQANSNPLLNDPFFRHFFNIPEQQRQQPAQRSQSAGSGVIIDAKEGTVITNHHVINGADEIKVALTDGRIFDAKLVGSDPEVDIAILDIDAKGLSELALADSEKARVGDFVVAIGNPFGLGQTVTTGVVSAIGRTGLGIEGYENFIQTDASINPGNSGGALVNLNGELVGINTAIIAPSGGNVGIGFAIPINMARNSLEQILEHGEVKRGQLGVVIQDLTPELAEAFDMKHQNGVVIAEVQAGSAAEKAGLQAGDVITAVDSKKMRSAAQLRNAVGQRRVGDKIALDLIRDGDTLTIKARIGESESAEEIAEAAGDSLEGARLVNNDDPAGVLVQEVRPGSSAMRSGLRPGDVITSVNRQSVANIKEFKRAAKGKDKQMLLRILRGNAALYLVLR